MKAYVAAGWFSPEQEKARLVILDSLIQVGLDYYSPKEMGLYIPGKSNPSEIFRDNLLEINSSDFIVASTEGKDMGTVFECGYAFAIKIPVVYFWENKFPLNLMLSESSIFVATSKDDLIRCLKMFKNNKEYKRLFKGVIE